MIKFSNRVWCLMIDGTIASRPATKKDLERRIKIAKQLGYSIQRRTL